MDRAKKREKEFAEDIDRLLAGKEAKVDEKMNEDYRSNIDFAGKIIECRGEPSPSFQEGLKRRLLSKLAEQEVAEAQQQETASFWDWLRNLILRNPAWRVATVPITVAVLALVVVLAIGLFPSSQEPILTGPLDGYSILEPLFFALGLVNSMFLIFVFLIRQSRPSLLQQIGWLYFLLSIPAAYGIFLVLQEHKAVQYGIFLGIFLAYLVLEWVYDFVLKINFRENWKRNWKSITPYLFLYYAMNYGFVVMSWKTSTIWGATMLCLFIIQITANLGTHPRRSKDKAC